MYLQKGAIFPPNTLEEIFLQTQNTNIIIQSLILGAPVPSSILNNFFDSKIRDRFPAKDWVDLFAMLVARGADPGQLRQELFEEFIRSISTAGPDADEQVNQARDLVRQIMSDVNVAKVYAKENKLFEQNENCSEGCL